MFSGDTAADGTVSLSPCDEYPVISAVSAGSRRSIHQIGARIRSAYDYYGEEGSFRRRTAGY